QRGGAARRRARQRGAAAAQAARMTRFLGCAALGCAAWIGVASAQSYPSKPVRVVVPAAPGGGQDLVIRLLQPGLTELLGQQLLVENRAGANGIVGAEHVARAGGDGYTLMFTGPSTIAPTLFPKPAVQYRYEDFQPIMVAVEPVSVL